VGGVSTAIPVTQEIKDKAMKMGEFLGAANKNKKEVPEQMKVIQSHRSFFRRIIEAHKEEWSGEYKYREEMGWL
jgi:hypothetical protein